MKRLAALAWMIAAAVAPNTTFAQGADPAQVERGDEMFQYWCSACHGRGPGHPGTQALDYRFQGAMPGALEDRTNLAPEYVEYVVRNGLFLMPFFRKTEINDEDLAAIGAYLSRTPPE
jgi:mono/diheme cytochrome c family protein